MEERLGEVSRALAAATQTASQLPGSTDLDFYCSIDRSVHNSLTNATESLGEVMCAMRSWIQNGVRDVPDMDDADHIATASTFTAAAGDLVDQLLERADVYLDEYAGRRTIAAPEHTPNETSDLMQSGPLPAHILNAQIPHPQRLFTTKPDNSADRAWSRPLRRGKPNAQVPLGWRDPKWEITSNALVTGPYSLEGDPRLNPYHVEIYATEVPQTAFAPPEPQAPEPIDLAHPAASTANGPFTWVHTATELEALHAHLAEDRVTEIAVDLEHHNKHSYLGIVCLMQISTRYGDWIVDTLSDEVRENAECLNEVFTDPRKVLVLHGADHDVLWLQRDLGVYVTCLFDTYHATNVLNFSVHSLAFLLMRYTSFEADKRFQLADWRIRPLPNEMLYYARSDTHSLLYIYDKLREELLAHGGPNAIRDVFVRSKGTASKVYAKEPWDEQGDSRSGWHTLWLRHGGDLARAAPQLKSVACMGKEERLMRRLHQWRDGVAREEDEGPQYVLSIQSLMHLVFRMPTSTEEVKRAIPASFATVRKRAPELARVIQSELEAWNADAQLREQNAQQELSAMVTPDADDVGEAVPVPTVVRDARFGNDVPAVCASVWQNVMPNAAPSARLYSGMLTVDPRGTITRPNKRKSLFDMPASYSHIPEILLRVRDECSDMLKRVLGAAPVLDEGEHEASASPTEKGEGQSTSPASGSKHQPSPMSPPREVPVVSNGHHAPELDDSDDEIVPVTKKARWTKDQKRQRKAANTKQITPFDYATTTSILEAPREENVAPPKQKGKSQDTSGFKPAKRKNDVRSGNRSATFGGKRK